MRFCVSRLHTSDVDMLDAHQYPSLFWVFPIPPGYTKSFSKHHSQTYWTKSPKPNVSQPIQIHSHQRTSRKQSLQSSNRSLFPRKSLLIANNQSKHRTQYRLVDSKSMSINTMAAWSIAVNAFVPAGPSLQYSSYTRHILFHGSTMIHAFLE